MPQATIATTAQGWPLLDAENYMDVIPTYTQQLATKLDNADADVAAAINAANRAQTAAANVPAMAHGTATINYTGGTGSQYLMVGFPSGRFATTPTIMLTSAAGYAGTSYLAAISYATQTSFRLYLYPQSSRPAESLAFNWLAVGGVV